MAKYLAFVLCCLFVVPASASPPPLIRSSEDTASRICLDFERPYNDLVLACQNALTEFRHTDFEKSRIYDHLGDALGELDRQVEARTAYRNSISAFPSHDYPWRGLGWSFWDTSDYDQAAKAFRTSLDLATTAASLAGLGSSLRRGDNFNEEVADLFERALLISPEYTWVMVEKGWMFFFRGEMTDAGKTFRKVLEMEPEYSSAAYGLSRTLVRINDLEGALAAINEALLVDGKDVVYVIQRASVLRRLGHKNLALKESRKAIELDPKEQDGFVEAARALRDLGRMPEGYEILDEAIANGVGANYLYFSYANMLTDEANWKKALKMVDKAVEFGAADERDHNLRAFILLKLDRSQDAIDASRIALEFDVANTTALVNIAYGELALGNTEQAVKFVLEANRVGIDEADINDFIAYVLSKDRFILAVRLRLEVSKQNLKAASENP